MRWPAFSGIFSASGRNQAFFECGSRNGECGNGNLEVGSWNAEVGMGNVEVGILSAVGCDWNLWGWKDK